MRISDWSSYVCSSDLTITCRLKPPAEARVWLEVPWIAGAVHIILLPIPLLSLRTTLVIHALLPGFLVAKMLDRRQTWMMAMAVSNAQIGREHVLTPVTNAHLVCRLLLEKKK